MSVVVVTEAVTGLRSDGTPFTLTAGETFDTDSDGYKTLPSSVQEAHFQPFSAKFGVEQASARPGEKRSTPPVKRPKAKAEKPEEKPAEEASEKSDDFAKAPEKD